MLRGWISKRGERNASTHSLDTLSEPQNRESIMHQATENSDYIFAVKSAMRAATHIMNDDLQSAEAGLADGASSFHKVRYSQKASPDI